MRIAEIFELGHRSGYDGKGRDRDWHRKGYSHRGRYSHGRKYRRRGGLLRISIGGY